MKIQYKNEFLKHLGVCDPITFFYQFICDENYYDDTKIIQFL